MTNNATLHDLYLYEAIEAGFKLEISQLREFYEAATATDIILSAAHALGCPGWHGAARCNCGGDERQARIDKALAALAEASEDDASEATA
jgi:hypothetical protein